MDIAINCQSGRDRTAPARLRSANAAVRLEVFAEMAAAEPFWRRLEEGGALATPYQRFDLLAPWQRHVGARAGVSPFIVAGLDQAGEPLFLWPLGRARLGPLELVRFLGSKHANFNVGLGRRDALASTDVRAVLEGVVAGHGIDLVALLRQPLAWDGIANPFAQLPHQPSVDMSVRVSFDRSTEDVVNHVLTASMRGRLRSKERKLQRLVGYRYLQATTPDEIDRLLERFFTLKSAHMAARGVGNVFAEAGVPEFLREACHRRLPDGRRLVEIHALEGGGEVLALFGAVVDGYRFSSMFNTYTLGEHSRHSPGLILLRHMIAECASRGLRSFDIGVGRAHYKSFFCREPEPLVDTFLPLTPRGRLAAAGFGAALATKRAIKQNRTLWAAIQTLRRVRAR
jgi:CelD/BcsL family acetyltransferase involved in cellulose biosynthesis